ncbi:MAG: ABC transporter arginine-binding protein 1 [Candidatus Celerinatantimonas neptuna]|nr:MAG: ABC transporter arginine-binding protein 1 [Candidatus Celerinatantimonas neptuna]
MKIKSFKHAGILFALCGIFQVAHAESALLKPGYFTVGMEVSYPPFESYKNNKVVGIDPTLAKLLAAKMGLKARFSDHKFSSLILGLKANRFDAVISGMYLLPDRLKQADAIAYTRTGALIMVTKGSQYQPKTKNDLCGLKVGLEQGTTWVKALSTLSKSYCQANGKAPIQVLEFPSAPETAQALMSHNVQAQLEIAGAARMFVKRTRGRITISSPDLVYPQTLGIYFKKGNRRLQTMLEKAMAEIKQDGSYAKLLKQYNLSAPTH